MLTSMIANHQQLPIFTGTIPKTLTWQPIQFWIVLLLSFLIFPGNYFWWSHSTFENPITSIVHRDQTVVKIPERQVKPQIILIYKNKDGKVIRALAYKNQYSEFIQLQVEKLQIAHQRIREAAQLQFVNGLNLVFDKIIDRIPQLGDWYYSYGTQYQLLWESINSAIHHIGDDNVRELISSDLEKIILKHYEYQVLKPELTQPELEHLYSEVLNSVHQSYLKVIADFDDDFQTFIGEQTTYMDGLPQLPELMLDWQTHIYKVRVAPDAGFTLGGVRSITFITVGAIMGKLVTQVFVNRAMLIIAGGTLGTGVGPVGTVIGATVGATVGMATDWLLHQGNELMSRPQFESEVLESVNGTKETIKNKLLPSLLHTINVQHDDLVQLVLKF